MNIRPFHHQRPLVCCALFYGAGVVAGVFFPFWLRLILSGLCLCLLGAYLLGRMGKRRATAFMGAFLFLGLLLSGHAAHPTLPPEGKFQITGIVAEEIILRKDGTAQGYLENACALTENGNISLGTVYWTFYPDEEPPLVPTDGQKVAFQGKVYIPSGPENPYGFDFRMFLLEKGIACGVSGAADMQVLSQESRGLASLFYRTRRFLSDRLEAVFQEESALPQALLLGEKERLPQDVQDSFSDAGVAHILSVSGLHVSMLAYLVMKLVPKRLGHRFRFVFLFLFLVFYLGLIGFPAPAVRAGIFLLLSRYRPIVRRGRDWPTIVASAFLIILLWQPLALFTASFQLSFCAVLGIFVFLPRLQKRFPRIAYKPLGKNVCVTLAAALGLILPLIQFFHSFSVIGLVINPLVCMLFMALLPIYALLLLLGCIWLPGAQTLSVPFHIITSAVTDLLTWAGKLPFATLPVPCLPWYCVAAVIISFILCTGLVVMNKKKKLLLAASALIVSFTIWPLTICRNVQYIQLSAGQCDAAIVTDGPDTILIDTGEYGGDAAAYLRSTGRKADILILTHLHKDHCLGTEQLLQNHIPIGKVIVPHGALDCLTDPECIALLKTLEEMGVPLHFMHAGQYFETTRCRFTALWPLENTVIPGQDANRYPLNLLCELDGVRLLTASDMEGDYELYAAQDADILKIAHHGSKNATSTAFLQSVSPDAAIITANGRSDTLPSPDTLSRLANMDVSVYNTGVWGAVTITCKDGSASIRTHLPPNGSVP